MVRNFWCPDQEMCLGLVREETSIVGQVVDAHQISSTTLCSLLGKVGKKVEQFLSRQIPGVLRTAWTFGSPITVSANAGVCNDDWTGDGLHALSVQSRSQKWMWTYMVPAGSRAPLLHFMSTSEEIQGWHCPES